MISPRVKFVQSPFKKPQSISIIQSDAQRLNLNESNMLPLHVRDGKESSSMLL